jgi:DNA gyrase subunit A
MDNTIDKIRIVNISDEMKKSYINYSMSVITARALPDAKDGLKPVQRRIIYTMHEDRLYFSAKYSKSSRIVGDVMGKYHPHGDISIYDALVHMAQYFSLRYPLVKGQGNFGSIDGDSPAAMRYTEAKLEKISDEIIKDIEKETVNFHDTYDGRLQEPDILPTAVPNLILNGTEGIAVGMATKIPPHNLKEVMSAIIYILDNIKSVSETNKLDDDVKVEDLMEYIKGPDFPTLGTIYDRDEILNMYMTGRGRVLTRGKAEIVENKSGKMQIIITELPFQVNKARLIIKIADLVKNEKIEGISDIRDESAKTDIRIVLDLKKDARAKIIINKLFKFTELQSVFNSNMLALVDGEPKTLNLKNILEIFIEHRITVIQKRTEFDLRKAKEREHILEGLKIAIDNIDEVINIIRSSKDADEAKLKLIKNFNLSEIQSQAILDMQLRRLAALERQKIEDELKSIRELISKLETILSDKFNIVKIVKNESREIIEKYGDERLTKVVKSKVGEFDIQDIVEDKETLITISKTGYIKRISPDTYKVQNRGGKGIIGMTTKEEDVISHAIMTTTLNDILFFSNKGRVFQSKVYEIPEFSRVAKGQPMVNFINLEGGENINAVITLDKSGNDYKYLFMTTKNGIVKKTKISDLSNIRKNGIIAIKLDKGDLLKWVEKTDGEKEVIVVTKNANSIRFKESDVRETGRASRGVRSIKMTTDNEVVGVGIVEEGTDVLIVSENGFGKRTPVEKYNTQIRGGKGVFASKINSKTGKIASMKMINTQSSEILIISNKGQIIKMDIASIPKHNRHTSGVKLINLKNGDIVSTIESN